MSSLLPDFLSDADGRFERTGPWGSLSPVEAWVEDERLVWRYSLEEEVPVGDGLLSAFLRLEHDVGGERIAAYVRRWGALHLCEHDLPASHSPACRPRRPDDADGWEPLDGYRGFARQAAALCGIALRVREGKRGKPDDWRIVYERSGHEAPWWRQDGDGKVEWLILYRVLNEWLGLGDVRPRLAALHAGGRLPGLELQLAGHELFGALAMQLAMVASGVRGFYGCHGCGELFTVPEGERKPQAGRFAYCPECRASRVPQRIASEMARRGRASGVAPT